MSSPARSTVSATSAGAISASDDVADSIDALYRKDDAMAGKPSRAHASPSFPFLSSFWILNRLWFCFPAELKSEVMEALQKEVRSLDDDSWMFAAPRSRINLVSMSGGYLRKQQEKLADLGQASKKTRNF
uniref:Uncharacterized protein n=1 Tax=Oryza punctata TaxID=4537 RepID=A0A0E0MB55_ORYPU